MGMYTEVFARLTLRRDTPPEVLALMEAWAAGFVTERERNALPEHPFFDCDRWYSVAQGASAYFPDIPVSAFTRADRLSAPTFAVHGNLKNYGNEIDLFFEWVDHYVDEFEGAFLGYSLHEESDNPRLHHKLRDNPR